MVSCTRYLFTQVGVKHDDRRDVHSVVCVLVCVCVDGGGGVEGNERSTGVNCIQQ